MICWIVLRLVSLAEFERELIRTRTGEGRERAKARGVILGRKPKLTSHQLGQDARKIHESPPPVQSAMGAIDRRKRVAHDRRRGYAERGYCPRFLPFQFLDHTR
jgi:hypothetical protein